jgi:hypothetical protein
VIAGLTLADPKPWQESLSFSLIDIIENKNYGFRQSNKGATW